MSTKLLAAVALFVGLLAPGVAAAAPPTTPAITLTTMDHRDTAVDSLTYDGCRWLQAFAAPEMTMSRSVPRRADDGTEADVHLYYGGGDTCTGITDFAINQYADLDDHEFAMDDWLRRAKLHFTTEVPNGVTGESAEVAIDLTWTGAGPATVTRAHSRYVGDGQACDIEQTDASRSARVVGTYTVGGNRLDIDTTSTLARTTTTTLCRSTVR